MQEYWHSSLLACERYLNSPYISVDQKLYKKVPNVFKEIRPWVKYGWEMILIVHEIIKTENPLKNDNSMGRRQVVRHRVLVSTFLGSNPSDPVLIFNWCLLKKFFYLILME